MTTLIAHRQSGEDLVVAFVEKVERTAAYCFWSIVQGVGKAGMFAGPAMALLFELQWPSSSLNGFGLSLFLLCLNMCLFLVFW